MIERFIVFILNAAIFDERYVFTVLIESLNPKDEADWKEEKSSKIVLNIRILENSINKHNDRKNLRHTSNS